MKKNNINVIVIALVPFVIYVSHVNRLFTDNVFILHAVDCSFGYLCPNTIVTSHKTKQAVGFWTVNSVLDWGLTSL